jgi:uncharacterized protein (TIGR00251 family)
MSEPRGDARAATPSWMRLAPGAVSVDVLARPSAPQTRIFRVDPRGLVVAVAAPPAKGKANSELIAFFARRLGLQRSAIEIVRGESARHKTIRIAARDPQAVANRLTALGTQS